MKKFAILMFVLTCTVALTSFGYTDTREEKQIILVQDQPEAFAVTAMKEFEGEILLTSIVAVMPGLITIGFEKLVYLEVTPKNTVARLSSKERPLNKSPVNDLKKSVTNSRRL